MVGWIAGKCVKTDAQDIENMFIYLRKHGILAEYVTHVY